ncbi:MAG: NeuD/PglB/VioB family sugar acetyltransferase [Pseudobacteriovorax sp.]|nr:NeuD/PglB/VioB family sugar acetyltransferase [Pseudobacteriovorax sp.]
MKDIAVIGAGGNSVDILETILDINHSMGKTVFRPIGFFDDNPALHGKEFSGFPVLGKLVDLKGYDGDLVFAIGSPNNHMRRHSIFESLEISKKRFPSIVHPSSYASRSAKLGDGVVVLQQVCIASSVELASFVMVLPQTVVSHGVKVGDFTLIAGGVSISGDCRVSNNCYIGTGSSLRGSVEVGSHSMVGMGSVVLSHVKKHSVVVGNPSRELRKNID